MNAKDVIDRFGKPDHILDADDPIIFHMGWKCSWCQQITLFDVPTRPPAPCSCGSIAFEAIERPTH
jgi:hypothetical protein